MTALQTVLARDIGKALKISERAVRKRADKEGWQYINGGNRSKKFIISKLPAEIQKGLIQKMDTISTNLIPVLSPEAALEASMRLAPIDDHRLSVQSRPGAWSDETALSLDVIRDPRVRRIARIAQEAIDVPRGWKKRKWIEAVAVKYDVTWQTIYKWIKKYEKKGLAGFKHRKNNGGRPKAWTAEAIDWWMGLCLKREHRKVAKDALYEILAIEAEKRGWNIGGYESALWWFNKKVTPQLQALQRGGARALDNSLPPILRSYADLDPFEILVGDQHRFDFWAVDDDSGEVFRPEGYFWQDLRTRCFYGGAADKKYDAFLCGLALRIGIKVFGSFKSIYTDNGKPELSRYIMGILADMKTLGLFWERSIEAVLDTGDLDGETVNPCTILPGTHRKAIVKNAKAKMIESTFNDLEGILRDHFKVPGYAKRLTASGEEQEIDQKEIERLAQNGKLLTFSEFVLKMYQAMDYYNNEKHHRGVRREWAWKPKPRAATPKDCLKACCLSGWRPRRLSEEAVDLIFLAKKSRTVDRGRIHFNNDIYEHEELTTISGRVDIRYDPMDPEWLLVFKGREFICRAHPVEYSSMKDRDLASRKIEEKRRRRKEFLTQYRALTSKVPDIREYSLLAPVEKAAALVIAKDRAESKKQKELYQVKTAEQLAAEVARIENYHTKDRPVFTNEVDRYRWCLDQAAAGKTLAGEDQAFIAEYEARMEPDTRDYWAVYKESVGVKEIGQHA